MSWNAVKMVVNTGKPPILGCLVGPFETEAEALAYGDKAGLFNLGYEQWHAREVQAPNNLDKPSKAG